MNNFLYFFHQHLFIFFIWFMLFFLIISTSIKNFFIKSIFIDIYYFVFLINKKKSFVIDTRSKKHFLLGHIPYSVNIPFKKIYNFDIKKLSLSKNTRIIFISYSNVSLNNYIEIFNKLGFNRLYILNNGLDDWNIKNLPLIYKK
ncbi:Uncharacterized protein YibN [Buchnera aphidicola (Periphyllus testudinaceus)]|uniref:rhodanese-like domain-containing protein n=1 Tax=Buchnera aphidicola TaxID=9 RepID=UPI003464116D